jgi:pimeloyl-ACP methyl ester carboxylesterase
MSEQPDANPAIELVHDTPFGALKQIDAGLLSVGYAEAGPADGRPVILLHGWPYDIHSYAGVTPMLASAGYRVIVPYLRGYGTTRFLATERGRAGYDKYRREFASLAGGPRIEPSQAASGTTCRKRLRRLWPRPSPTPTATDL